MKVLCLDLRAFGPFENVMLEFSAGNLGLHVIYGPNEAGKTSALRALENLLFGIPQQSPDSFRHPYTALRVGATLELSDGRRIAFLRRKAARSTLLAPDNRTPLAEDALAPFVGSLDREGFRTMFGLDHAALVQGGEKIVQGSGQVGQVLFAAGAGIGDLRKVQQQLRKSADDLYTPRGRNPRINEALRKLEEARRRLREGQLLADQWARHRRALEEAQQQLAAVDQQRQELQTRRNRLERLRLAFGAAGRRRTLVEGLAALADVAILAPDFAERRREAVTQLALARQEQAGAEKEIQRIRCELKELVVPEALLNEASAIEELADRLGAHRKAQRDLPRLVAERQAAARRLEEVLVTLRPDLSPDLAHTLFLTSAQQDRIHRLVQQYTRLRTELEAARKAVEDRKREAQDAESSLAGLAAVPDTRGLQAVLHAVQSEGDLESQLGEHQRQIARLARAIEGEVARLHPWSGPWDALEALPVPSDETVERFDRQLGEAHQALAHWENQCQEKCQQRDRILRDLEAMALEGAVPSETELAEARSRRDTGWQLIRRAWLGEAEDRGLWADYLGRPASPHDLADAFTRSMAQADELADRLRREADRVAKRAQLDAQSKAAQHELELAESRSREAKGRLERLQDQWRAAWQPAGIEPLSPAEMRAWMVRYRDALRQIQTLRDHQTHVEILRQKIESHRRALLQELAALGAAPAAELPSLAGLVRRSQELLEELRQRRQQRQQLESDIQRARAELQRACAEIQSAEEGLRRWEEQWALALEPVGLDGRSQPEIAQSVLQSIQELRECHRRKAELAERVEGIGADARRFLGDVAELCRRLAPDLVGKPEDEAVRALQERLNKARADYRRHGELRKELGRWGQKREKAEQAVGRYLTELELLCQEARCKSVDELPRAEQAAAEKARLREELAGVEQRLAELCGGGSLEALLAELAAVDADALPSQIEQLDHELRQVEQRRDELLQTIGSHQEALEKMDAASTAAEAAEEIESLRARLEGDAEQFLRLRLALAVLGHAIERYRKKHEGPVLRRAGELFARLTCGAFQGLVADFDDQGNSVLKGVRAGGAEQVELAGMSDGTADQLFLALRLASLEHYLEGKEPWPLVLDDVLVGFDDARAGAALEVLAELSSRTQVLLFTHHAHLVRLAEERLAGRDPPVLFVHCLGGGE